MAPNVKDGVLQNHGSVLFKDTSAGLYGIGVSQVDATGSVRMTLYGMAPSVTGAGEAAIITHAKPFAWGDGAYIEMTTFYPVA